MGLMRSKEHTSELQSPVVISYAVFCLKKKKKVGKGFYEAVPAAVSPLVATNFSVPLQVVGYGPIAQRLDAHLDSAQVQFSRDTEKNFVELQVGPTELHVTDG